MCRSRRHQDHFDGGRHGTDAAHHRTARHDAAEMTQTGNALLKIKHPTKSALIPALALAVSIGASAFAGPAAAQSAASEGQKLAFDRSKGNCLTCHVIKGGDLPGSIGPELSDIKSRYPNREDLVAILY